MLSANLEPIDIDHLVRSTLVLFIAIDPLGNAPYSMVLQQLYPMRKDV